MISPPLLPAYPFDRQHDHRLVYVYVCVEEPSHQEVELSLFFQTLRLSGCESLSSEQPKRVPFIRACNDT